MIMLNYATDVKCTEVIKTIVKVETDTFPHSLCDNVYTYVLDVELLLGLSLKYFPHRSMLPSKFHHILRTISQFVLLGEN